jgi:hypothetical protein
MQLSAKDALIECQCITMVPPFPGLKGPPKTVVRSHKHAVIHTVMTAQLPVVQNKNARQVLDARVEL